MKNIVLCGFMGCGKTAVGRRLSPMIARRFVDMDSYIEQQAQKRVSTIFADDGEAAFRRLEHDACLTLGQEQGIIIATGGGAVATEQNVQALKANGTIIWLRVTPETVRTRLAHDHTRPLLMRPDKETAIRCLMAEREPLYRRAADVIIDADADPFTVTQAVKKALSL